MPSQLIIDKKILNGFKSRALRAYPNEFLEIMLGRVDDGKVFVYGFAPFEHEGDKNFVHVDSESIYNQDQDDYKHRIIGSVHTHPNSSCEPSQLDRKAAKEEGEIIFGVCGIKKNKSGRRFVSWSFWDNSDDSQLELVVAE